MNTYLHRLIATALLLGSLCLLPGNARAETYNTCAGFIDSLPATISTQGVWCLRHDLATSMASGAAINITTNNVTIDCNSFKIGGLGAGDSSQTNGIYADHRQNVSVRHCNIRGFQQGIALAGGAGHLVEDNRLDNNLVIGISAEGDNSLVQRNRVYDTGGFPGSTFSYGIVAEADVIDNTVAGVFVTSTNASPTGILIEGAGNEARGNRVRGLVVAGSGTAHGIRVSGSNITVDGNRIAAATGTAGVGILGFGTTDTFCSNNTIAGFNIAIADCQDAGGNANH